MPAPTPALTVAIEDWPLSAPFVISRGVKTSARVVVATITTENGVGRGECVPYARYGETAEGVVEAIQTCGVPGSREDLCRRLPPGAARNALDCALWDLEAKASGRDAASLASLKAFQPVETCFTLSLGTADSMAAAAAAVPQLNLLKLKLGGAGDDLRMTAVRKARPDARLVADANEAWTPDLLVPLLSAAAEAGIELIEQPLPAGNDSALAAIKRPVPVCADESAHVAADVACLADRYDAVNIKLDKAGGLTEALAMASAAEAHGLDIMVGCMVATSLAMAPALILASRARWVDLDGPLLLARDRGHGLDIRDGWINRPDPRLWGGGWST